MASNVGGKSSGGGCVGTLVSLVIFLAIASMLISDPSGTAHTVGQIVTFLKNLAGAIGTFLGDLMSSQGGGQ